MTVARDVVLRLRDSHHQLVMVSGGRLERSLHSDAADEIERLREELQAMAAR